MKRAAELLLDRSKLLSLARRRLQGRSAILAYHNVVPDGRRPVGDASLHLSRSAFAAQLDSLVESCTVVPLDGVLQSPGEEADRPRVAITFDDGYRGAVDLGVEELVRRGLPATFFVSPGQLGDKSFWWDELAAGDGSGLDPVYRGRALGELRGDDGAIRAWAQENGLAVTPLAKEWRSASVAELEMALDHPGISVASHSWSHRNLTRLTDTELREELRPSRTWLQENFPSVLPWFSYPYGISTETVEEAARAAGYEAALRIQGGWVEKSPANLYRLPRINVPSRVSLEGFRLRLAGLLAG